MEINGAPVDTEVYIEEVRIFQVITLESQPKMSGKVATICGCAANNERAIDHTIAVIFSSCLTYTFDSHSALDSLAIRHPNIFLKE